VQRPVKSFGICFPTKTEAAAPGINSRPPDDGARENQKHGKNSPGGIDQAACLCKQKIVVQVREPQDKAKSESNGIAQIGARVGIEQALQFFVAALQGDLNGLVGIFSQEDLGHVVFGISPLGHLPEFILGHPRTRPGGHAWLARQRLHHFPPENQRGARHAHEQNV
jgi:hypothetical protein